MAVIVLFHSVLGLRELERGLAQAWRSDGHEVVLDDLYDGRTAERYADGFALLDDIGMTTVRDRALAVAAAAPADAILAGVSMGAGLASEAWRTKPETRGVLLLAGIAPWPGYVRSGTPVAVHAARPDPFDDEAAIAAFEADNPGADLDLHRYDDVGHLFLDPGSPEYAREAADRCRESCRAFLSGL